MSENGPLVTDSAPLPENEVLRSFATSFIAALSEAIPPFIEFVLHDLSKLPNSVVAVTGNVTGRRPGDPATNLLLEQIAAKNLDRMVGYVTRLPNGRELRSSTILMRNSSGEAVVAICINLDISAWSELRGLVDSVFENVSNAVAPNQQGEQDEVESLPVLSTRPAQPHTSESFMHDIDELTSMMLDAVIAEVGLPVSMMKKRHKLSVVEALKQRGFFLRRDGVNLAAAALDVSRFTVYNYLQELGAEDAERA